ncbi:hypothetical protein NEIRO03_0398 [Nematocida sp. AWRm78]|nr:hypothetical protein NEIRO02_0358 [Nematocida sp. AWRm79]KAI5182747.1 hypothetical protein NEIRO03_0398 [Nematocida sp. AWRm78]
MEEKQNLLKKNNIIIRNTLKNTILILLVIKMIIHGVCAKLGGKDTELAQEMVIGDNLVLHPDGGLSPTLQYMASESEFMKNFRMYWHGIYAEEGRKKNSRSTKDYENFKVWKIHDIIHEDEKKNKYLKEFAQQLINMFPSENGVYSIESVKDDSFIRFLRMYKDKSYTLNLLAALFLLAEGVDIPIEIVDQKGNTGNKIIILEKKEINNGFFVNLSLTIEEGKSAYHKKTEEIINFFKHLVDPAGALEVPEEFLMPTTYEEFLKGNFLCNPKFLIQSYIFEYIDSVEMHDEFVIAVYGILNEHKPTNCDSPTTNADEHTLAVFNQLFVDSNKEASVGTFSYILVRLKSTKLAIEMYNKRRNFTDFCKFKRAKDECKNTPFIDVIYRPSYIDGPNYVDKSCQYTLSYKDKRCFKNCQNSVLLALFLCFAFDPETEEYNIDHIPDASNELKEFFSKYTHKVSSISLTMRSDWERVVEGLPKPEHGFSTDGSTVNTGLLHMLYTMYDLVGKKHGIKKVIKYIKNKFLEDYNNDERNVKQRMRCHLENIFSSLSRRNPVGVICNYLTPVSTTIDGKSVINVNIESSLLYDFDSKWYGIKFTVSKSYNNPLVEIIEDEDGISFCKSCSDNKSYYRKITRNLSEYQQNPKDSIYMDPKTYPQMIIKQFTSEKYKFEFLGTSYETKKTFIIKTSYEANKREIVNRNCNDPNRLMLWGSLDDLEYKSHLIKMFLIHSNIETLSIDNPMVRFTSNLIRNVSMNSLRARRCILSACAYNNDYKIYYPRLNEYDMYSIPKTEISSNGLSTSMTSLFDIEVIDNSSLINSYMSLLQVYKKDLQIPYLFSDLPVIISILNEISQRIFNSMHPKYKNKMESPDKESTNKDKIRPKELLNSRSKSIFNDIHKELIDAMPSPVDNNITAIYVCWIFNIINSHYPFSLVDIKSIYTRINRHFLSNKIKDILGYKLSNKNITKFINFLEDNKSELYDKTDAYEFEEKYQAIIALFNNYNQK